MGRPVTENNFQQAMIPEGATVLDNDWGTAPRGGHGGRRHPRADAPRPPRECEMMFRHRAVPLPERALGRGDRLPHVKTFGIGESAAEALLRDLMNSLHNPPWPPMPSPPARSCGSTAHGPDRGGGPGPHCPCGGPGQGPAGGQGHWGGCVLFGGSLLWAAEGAGLTVGTAESCTGGLLAKLLTDLPGSLPCFGGACQLYQCGESRCLGGPSDTAGPIRRGLSPGGRGHGPGSQSRSGV